MKKKYKNGKEHRAGPSNYYGGLEIKYEDGDWYWSVENWDGHHWSKISETLAEALIKQLEKDQKDVG